MSSHVRPVRARLNVAKKSILHVGPTLWNSRDEYVKDIRSPVVFSMQFKNHDLQSFYMCHYYFKHANYIIQ